MRKICLSLPTNRACAATISAVAEEAAYAAEHFGVEVHLLILDSADEHEFAAHAEVVLAVSGIPNVAVWHLDETRQRDFLRRVIELSGVEKPDLMLDLMLPREPSYGACTNRAFLLGSALGCDSIHRRDSDSSYQTHNGATVFPIHHELMSLGKSAAEAANGVSETVLEAAYVHRPVAMVGSSFVGELSVDIAEIQRTDENVYHDVVSLWAPGDWSAEEKKQLVDESFKGAGSDIFAGDRSTLTIVDPMLVDMCNISFHQVHEDVPLPPATNTIGSDYFLIHLVHDAGLPGVRHNRNIVNFYTGERRTAAGFQSYQLRFAKFFLSMLYFHFIYGKMAAAGASLLDDRNRVRASVISEFVSESTELAKDENVRRLDSLDRAYRKLGGKYAEFADSLLPRRARLLAEAQQDIVDFALLIESWEPLIEASRATSIGQSQR